MHSLEAIVLGIVQGLTEFLPISSTAHLRIVPAFAGWEDPGAAFTAVVQLGTTLAVLIYFRRDLLQIARGLLAGLRDPAARRTAEWRLGLFIILGTIPIGVLGLALKHRIEHEFRTLELIGVALIVVGLILAWSENAAGATASARSSELTGRDAAIIGFAQAAALVPGVSRSGATISAGLFLGLDRVAAARYSFLLSVPAIVAVGPLRAQGRRRGRRLRRRPDDHRHAAGLRRRLRLDRLAAALHHPPPFDAVRGLPRASSASGSSRSPRPGRSARGRAARRPAGRPAPRARAPRSG